MKQKIAAGNGQGTCQNKDGQDSRLGQLQIAVFSIMNQQAKHYQSKHDNTNQQDPE
jgi:hypothetical protein